MDQRGWEAHIGRETSHIGRGASIFGEKRHMYIVLGFVLPSCGLGTPQNGVEEAMKHCSSGFFKLFKFLCLTDLLLLLIIFPNSNV